MEATPGVHGLHLQLSAIDDLIRLDRGRLFEAHSPQAAAKAEWLLVSNGYVPQDCGAEAGKCYWIDYGRKTTVSTSEYHVLVAIRYVPRVWNELKIPLVPMWLLGNDLMRVTDPELVTQDPSSDAEAKGLMRRFQSEHPTYPLMWFSRFRDFL
jgi:hypothetical protein